MEIECHSCGKKTLKNLSRCMYCDAVILRPLLGEKPRKTQKEYNSFAVLIGLCGMMFLIITIVDIVVDSVYGPHPHAPKKTDGVFESATKKIDQGRSSELTEQEKQRIDDIMNWCKICDKPLRHCKHGR